jgi:hypothetical protein
MALEGNSNVVETVVQLLRTDLLTWRRSCASY